MWGQGLFAAAAAAALQDLYPPRRRRHKLADTPVTERALTRPLQDVPTPVKGALDRDGPVLQREYSGEEINISVMRLSNIFPAGAEDEDGDSNDAISQLFLQVDVSKPGRKEGLHFLCGLYLDAIGIHSVCLRMKDEDLRSRSLIK